MIFMSGISISLTIIERTSRLLFKAARFLAEAPHAEMLIRLRGQTSTSEKMAPSCWRESDKWFVMCGRGTRAGVVNNFVLEK